MPTSLTQFGPNSTSYIGALYLGGAWETLEEKVVGGGVSEKKVTRKKNLGLIYLHKISQIYGYGECVYCWTKRGGFDPITNIR